MNSRLRHIIVKPSDSIRTAMERIEKGAKMNPPAPWGIALVMEKGKLLGIATDGDIRRAILKGKNLSEPIKGVMVQRPLSIRSGSPREMLAELYEQISSRGGSESKYHQVLVVDADGELEDVVTPFELWRLSDVKVKTVAVIGLGYVGLTLALVLNEFGIRVVGVDTNAAVIAKLKKGIPHFYEKGLDKLLKKHANKLLTLKTALSKDEVDVFVVCVGTPVDDRGSVQTNYLKDAISKVGSVLKAHDLVILRSTVPIGTCRSLVIPLLQKHSGLSPERDFFVAFAPERTVEGKALEELRTLPQVIGGMNKQSLDAASQFFQIFVRTIVAVENLEEAEAVKLLNNTFRDVSFGFANEVAQVLHNHELNARRVIHAANEGYGRNPIPAPSPGVGGACLVKDPYLFTQSATPKGYQPKLPLAARNINVSMINFIADQVDTFLKKSGKKASAKLFLMGMAFKGVPETSDIRFSTSVDILQKLQKTYKNISIYDPVAHKEDMKSLKATVVNSPKAGFHGADAVLVLNNHPSFADLDIFTLAKSMKQPGWLFDPWGLYTTEQISAVPGVQYMGL